MICSHGVSITAADASQLWGRSLTPIRSPDLGTAHTWPYRLRLSSVHSLGTAETKGTSAPNPSTKATP
jgi:hypothetical protein